MLLKSSHLFYQVTSCKVLEQHTAVLYYIIIFLSLCFNLVQCSSEYLVWMLDERRVCVYKGQGVHQSYRFNYHILCPVTLNFQNGILKLRAAQCSYKLVSDRKLNKSFSFICEIVFFVVNQEKKFPNLYRETMQCYLKQVLLIFLFF